MTEQKTTTAEDLMRIAKDTANDIRRIADDIESGVSFEFDVNYHPKRGPDKDGCVTYEETDKRTYSVTYKPPPASSDPQPS